MDSFPNFCFCPSKYCFPQALPVFLAFLPINNISKNIVTDAGQQVLAITTYLNFGEIKGTTRRKMNSLWKAKASFCWFCF